MKKCPSGFKKIGDKCVRKTTYKSSLLKQKEELERAQKYKELKKDIASVVSKKRKKG